MKIVWLGATLALALASSSAGAFDTTHPLASKKHYVVLWNQNSNFGGSVNSQFYETSMEAYDDYAADDFVVPGGQRWYISEVDVTGAYTNGSGPASSEVVIFWTDKHGHPLRVAQGRHDWFTLNCIDNAGSFQCVLPTTGIHDRPVVRLDPGTYWLSIVANCDSQTCGEWDWTENTSVTGHESEWANPSGAWDIRACYGWNVLSTCFGGSPADLAFELIGLSRPIP